MSVVVGLLSETRMKKLLMLGLGWVKRGRGHLVVRTVAATFTMVFGSALFDVVNYRRRMSETGKRINPTYEVLITNHLLETSLMAIVGVKCNKECRMMTARSRIDKNIVDISLKIVSNPSGGPFAFEGSMQYLSH
ncbi:hypothetical protein CRG98_011935 [Punica granatum]|uniref:Uncharacterized protein n=1 Tax=Punica granatum TaxID=22663 RepID=A0A2I0KGR9_PUNGR|nr:hypothetical protein CRG98_011935 [Punica granatum]